MKDKKTDPNDECLALVNRISEMVLEANYDFFPNKIERPIDRDKDFYLYVGINPHVKILRSRVSSTQILKIYKRSNKLVLQMNREDLFSAMYRYFIKLFYYADSKSRQFISFDLFLACGNPSDFAYFTYNKMDDSYNIVKKIKCTSELKRIPIIDSSPTVSEINVISAISTYKTEDLFFIVKAKLRFNPYLFAHITTFCADGRAIFYEQSDTQINLNNGYDFESFCVQVLKRKGFENVQLTPGSGDQGIDIIAYRDLVKYGIQCKYYSGPVGNKAVQEALAGKSYYKCHVAIVLTNSTFTRQAVDLAKRTGIILWDKSFLKSLGENISGVSEDERATSVDLIDAIYPVYDKSKEYMISNTNVSTTALIANYGCTYEQAKVLLELAKLENIVNDDQ